MHCKLIPSLLLLPSLDHLQNVISL